MAKKILRLTESDLHKVIRESVERIMEDRFGRYTDAYTASSNAPQSRIDAYDAKHGDGAWLRREINFRNASTKAFNDEYGYNVKADWEGNATPIDSNKPIYGGTHMYTYDGSTFETGRGKTDGNNSEWSNRQSIGTTRPNMNRYGKMRGNEGQSFDRSDEVTTSSAHMPSKLAQIRGDKRIRQQFKQ